MDTISDLVPEIILYATESHLSLSDKKSFISGLLTLSKRFMRIILQIKPKLLLQFAWEELLDENDDASDNLYFPDPFDVRIYGTEVRVNSWTANGKWEKGMFLKRSEGEFPQLNLDSISTKYLAFNNDAKEIMNMDFTKALQSHTSFWNYFFFIRKYGFKRKVETEIEPLDVLQTKALYQYNLFKSQPEIAKIDKVEIDVEDPNYTELFWRHFISFSGNRNAFGSISIFQQEINRFRKHLHLRKWRSKWKTEVDPSIPFETWLDTNLTFEIEEYESEQPAKKMKNSSIATEIEKVFERHFPGKHSYYSTCNTSSEWVGLQFFIGETDDYFMGFYFFAERDS
jgi:hypothetical protein